ncbi:MAG: branched chain amino acid aminotransferase [Isosphaeraceae bacterium]|jgi:branched-chain amino acid aminotransferase|nr:MAG: branched chain amino acid aminotransferase [Isosphaeraceae bacterium]
MTPLQTPEFAFMGGRLIPWKDAVLHVSTEAINRGLNVYEGLKGYWRHDGAGFGVVAMRRHYDRLRRSAALLHIPCPVDFDTFRDSCRQLFRALLRRDRDMWLRATLYVVEGHWGEGTVADLVLTAYHQDPTPPKPIRVGVSTWRRSSDVSLPPRIKTSANYNVARLARIEGRPRGCSEMILLNQWDRVAEATGACLIMVRDGTVVTPPPSEGRLESITVQIVAALCQSLAIPYQERPIERTELLIADELALAGTLSELTPIEQLDHYRLPPQTPILNALSSRFWGAVRGVNPHPAIDLEPVDTHDLPGDVRPVIFPAP